MNSDEVDFFSFLPDALILIIISCLPFKQAVRTSVLSTRWRNLWRSTRTVDLDENFFAANKEEVNSMANRRKFVGFIRRWMANFQEPNLENFRFVFTSLGPAFHIVDAYDCVKFAVEGREVTKSLHLDFSNPLWDEENLDITPRTPIHLPFFDGHEKIESLELCACGFRVREPFNRFSALKNVFLGWIELPGSSLNKFLSMCPLLEILSLKRCWNVGNLNIDAQRLRVLVLDKILEPQYIYINAPLLRFFKYCGACVYMAMEYNRSMVEAVLDFGMEKEWDEGNAEMLYNLLIEFWSVKVLTICSYMLQVLPRTELFLKPSLASVTHLVLQTQLHIKEYYGITFFLNSCPRLEMLWLDLGPKRIFEDCQPPYKNEEHPFFSNLWCPACVRNTLSTVKVKGYKGVTYEQMVLKYLLRNGKALKYLFISLSKGSGANGIDMEPTYKENLESLLQYDITSPHLQIYTYAD